MGPAALGTSSSKMDASLGSLEALMEHLVPTVDYYPDVSAW